MSSAKKSFVKVKSSPILKDRPQRERAKPDLYTPAKAASTKKKDVLSAQQDSTPKTPKGKRSKHYKAEEEVDDIDDGIDDDDDALYEIDPEEVRDFKARPGLGYKQSQPRYDPIDYASHHAVRDSSSESSDSEEDSRSDTHRNQRRSLKQMARVMAPLWGLTYEAALLFITELMDSYFIRVDTFINIQTLDLRTVCEPVCVLLRYVYRRDFEVHDVYTLSLDTPAALGIAWVNMLAQRNMAMGKAQLYVCALGRLLGLVKIGLTTMTAHDAVVFVRFQLKACDSMMRTLREQQYTEPRQRAAYRDAIAAGEHDRELNILAGKGAKAAGKVRRTEKTQTKFAKPARRSDGYAATDAPKCYDCGARVPRHVPWAEHRKTCHRRAT